MQISQLANPYEAFRLDADAQMPPPKWAPANKWTMQDDSMLLLGAYLYGICHWDNLAADPQLGLGNKLDGAIKDGPRVADKNWPQGAHPTPARVAPCLSRAAPASCTRPSLRLPSSADCSRSQMHPESSHCCTV